MAIGFIDEKAVEQKQLQVTKAQLKQSEPVPSVVWVDFESGRTLAYYNDKFDLKIGDNVFVEGKFEGKVGEVVEIEYSFKIPLDKYKRVKAQIRKSVSGRWQKMFSVAVSLQEDALPFDEYKTWVFPPKDENSPAQEWASAGGYSFVLEDFEQSKFFDGATFEKGFDLLQNGAIKYFSYRAGRCHAIIKGRKYYVVEFDYKDGEVTNLLCDCACASVCKHCAAAIIFFKALSHKLMTEAQFDENGCITALDFGEFLNIVTKNENFITIEKEAK